MFSDRTPTVNYNSASRYQLQRTELLSQKQQRKHTQPMSTSRKNKKAKKKLPTDILEDDIDVGGHLTNDAFFGSDPYSKSKYKQPSLGQNTLNFNLDFLQKLASTSVSAPLAVTTNMKFPPGESLEYISPKEVDPVESQSSSLVFNSQSTIPLRNSQVFGNLDVSYSSDILDSPKHKEATSRTTDLDQSYDSSSSEENLLKNVRFSVEELEYQPQTYYTEPHPSESFVSFETYNSEIGRKDADDSVRLSRSSFVSEPSIMSSIATEEPSVLSSMNTISDYVDESIVTDHSPRTPQHSNLYDSIQSEQELKDEFEEEFEDEFDELDEEFLDAIQDDSSQLIESNNSNSNNDTTRTKDGLDDIGDLSKDLEDLEDFDDFEEFDDFERDALNESGIEPEVPQNETTVPVANVAKDEPSQSETQSMKVSRKTEIGTQTDLEQVSLEKNETTTQTENGSSLNSIEESMQTDMPFISRFKESAQNVHLKHPRPPQLEAPTFMDGISRTLGFSPLNSARFIQLYQLSLNEWYKNELNQIQMNCTMNQVRFQHNVEMTGWTSPTSPSNFTSYSYASLKKTKEQIESIR